jgi:hypothetical protein
LLQQPLNILLSLAVVAVAAVLVPVVAQVAIEQERLL